MIIVLGKNKKKGEKKMAKSTKKETKEVLEETTVEEVKEAAPVEVEENTTADAEPVSVEKEEVVEEDLPPHVDVKPDPAPKSKSLGKTTGVVVNCNALRLREGANIKTRELAQIPVDTKVEINLDNSTESFYEVTYQDGANLLIGFCVKQFIKVG
jgi:hypothetical protein